MISIIYNLCVEQVNMASLVGGYITLVIDIVASLVLLVKAIKAKNVSWADFTHFVKEVFSKREKTPEEKKEEPPEKEKKEDDENVQQ